MIKNEGVRPEGPTTSFPLISCDRLKFKSSLPGLEPSRLPDGSEARDLLVDILVEDGLCIAVFKFGPVAQPPELGPRLREYVGRETAILRLDGKYHCRAV